MAGIAGIAGAACLGGAGGANLLSIAPCEYRFPGTTGVGASFVDDTLAWKNLVGSEPDGCESE